MYIKNEIVNSLERKTLLIICATGLGSSWVEQGDVTGRKAVAERQDQMTIAGGGEGRKTSEETVDSAVFLPEKSGFEAEEAGSNLSEDRRGADGSPAKGHSPRWVELPEVKPWDEAVDGAALLDALKRELE